MDITQKANPILLCLLRISQKNGKDYCFPSQKTIIKLMRQFRTVDKSRATLNRWLRVIEDGKYLMRRRRIKKDPEGGMMFKSTLYKITIKGYYLLRSFGVNVYTEIKAFEKWRESIRPRKEGKEKKKDLDPEKRTNGATRWVKKLIKDSLGSVLWNL